MQISVACFDRISSLCSIGISSLCCWIWGIQDMNIIHVAWHGMNRDNAAIASENNQLIFF